ncbi:MAG: OsmC family protein [Candidatus Thorarchaeota archaeon]|nr:OsmC family protein [Candidatus Thorarchaeota archaeon]
MSEHAYELTVATVDDRVVEVNIPDVAPFKVTAAKDWWPDAPDGMLSPQTMLVSASATCIVLSLYKAAYKLRTMFDKVTVSARGEMEEIDNGYWNFGTMKLTLKIWIPSADERSKIEKAVRLAHESCPVANTLKWDTELNFDIIVS